MTESVAQDQIKAFVERIMRLREEAKAINGDIREVYAEAKGNGFDKTVLGKVVGYVEKRAAGAADLQEAEALFDLYLSAYDGAAGTRVATHTHEADTSSQHRPSETTGVVPTKASTGANAGGENVDAPIAQDTEILENVDDTRDGGLAPISAVELGAPVPSNVTQLQTKKRVTFNDPAHADCLEPERCGGFSNLKLCQRCQEAAAGGQVA